MILCSTWGLTWRKREKNGKLCFHAHFINAYKLFLVSKFNIFYFTLPQMEWFTISGIFLWNMWWQQWFSLASSEHRDRNRGKDLPFVQLTSETEFEHLARDMYCISADGRSGCCPKKTNTNVLTPSERWMRWCGQITTDLRWQQVWLPHFLPNCLFFPFKGFKRLRQMMWY